MTRVKICGLTSLVDAEEAVRLGAWAVGLIHHEPSVRFCPPGVAAEIGAALKRRCEVVGVFVNAHLDEIARAAENAELTMVQLHGDEGPAFCLEVARRTGCKTIKAARVRDAGDVRALDAFQVDFHMLDTHRPDLPGGTGETFDWNLASTRNSSIPLVLSGGLRPENVGEAIAAVHPYAVDVASGVEAEPGRKDHAQMQAFFEAANAGAVL